MAEREGAGNAHQAAADDPRKWQLVVGLSVMGVLIAVVPAFYIVWRFVPGLFGEWLGVIAGIMSTPFLLEFFFICIGLIIVVGLNSWRRTREGDEFVYLEQVDDPRAPADMPERAKFAIYKERPAHGEEPGLADQAEGAMAIRDFAEAAKLFAAMDEDELRLPGVMALRIELARATGKPQLAARLEREMTTPA